MHEHLHMLTNFNQIHEPKLRQISSSLYVKEAFSLWLLSTTLKKKGRKFDKWHVLRCPSKSASWCHIDTLKSCDWRRWSACCERQAVQRYNIMLTWIIFIHSVVNLEKQNTLFTYFTLSIWNPPSTPLISCQTKCCCRGWCWCGCRRVHPGRVGWV